MIDPFLLVGVSVRQPAVLVGVVLLGVLLVGVSEPRAPVSSPAQGRKQVMDGLQPPQVPLVFHRRAQSGDGG